MTEEKLPTRYEEDTIDLGEYFAILRKGWWKIILFSLAVGLATLIVMFQLPDIYQATAVLTPAVDEKRPNPALGILASFGVDIGSPTKVEDLETLFQSNDLTARVFRKYNLWPIVLPDRFDPATGKMKFRWTDRLFGAEKGAKSAGRLGRDTRCKGSPAGFHSTRWPARFPSPSNLLLRKGPPTS